MKSKYLLLIGTALCSSFTAVNPTFAQSASSTTFTYQGRLTDTGSSASGGYDLTFAVFDAESSGSQVGATLTNSAVAVSNGLFTVALDFGAGIFTGPDRWLEIGVRTNGDGDFATLSPRQALTASPYAIFAGTSANVASGSVVTSLNGLKDDVTLEAGNNVSLTPNGNTLTIAAATGGGSSIWSALNNNAFYNTGNVGIGTNIPAHRLSIAGGPSWTANLWKGALDLEYGAAIAFRGNAGTQYGIGSASGGLYFFHTASGPGTTGSPSVFDLELANSGHLLIGGPSSDRSGIPLQVNGNLLLTPGGSGGEVQFGTPNAETGMTIIGANRADLRFDGSMIKLLANAGTGVPPTANGITVDTSGNIGVGQSMFFGSQTRQMFNLFGTGFGVGVQTSDLYFRSGGGFAWHVGGVHTDATYNSGGGTTVATLDLTTGLDFGSRLGQHLSLWGGVGARRFDIGMQASTEYFRTGNGVGDAFAWYKGGIHNDGQRNAGGGQSLMTLDGESGLFVAGAASVCTLTIRGGCDLAEPFPMKEVQAEKGSVVVIDEEHPGQLKLSTEAYDTRVAGILSGGNGVNTGIALHQEGIMDGGQNVALSGRVYVQADATFGAIKPGDLLTTSDTPGHAMKVSDHAKAQGAILGKAMSPLKQGKGMVLVLVTLQ